MQLRTRRVKTLAMCSCVLARKPGISSGDRSSPMAASKAECVRDRQPQPGDRGGNRSGDFGAVDAAEIDEPGASRCGRARALATAASPTSAKSPWRRASSAKATDVSGVRDRKFHRDDQLAGPQIGLEQALEKILRLHVPFAGKTAEHERGTERHGSRPGARPRGRRRPGCPRAYRGCGSPHVRYETQHARATAGAFGSVSERRSSQCLVSAPNRISRSS